MARNNASPNKARWPYTLNANSPQAQGLVGWWPGGPSGGPRLFDRSGRGRHATVAGTIPTTGVWGPGKDGGKAAMQLDGSTNYWNTGNQTAITASFITGTAWIKTSAAANTQRIISKDDGSTRDFTMIESSGGFLQALVWNQAATLGNAIGATYTIRDGNWHFVCFTWDGVTVRTYVDGKADTTAALAGTSVHNGAVSLAFGVRSDLLAFFWSGLIEDARLYNRCLNVPELTNIYRKPWDLRYQPGSMEYLFASTSGAAQYFLMFD